MPKVSKKYKSGRRHPERGGNKGSLGAGEGDIVVAVPKSIQTVTRQYILGADALGSNALIWQFQSAASTVLNLSSWLTLYGSNWASLSGLYDEFQPISVRVRGVHSLPIGSYNQPFLLAYDNDGGAPLTPSVALVSQYRTCKIIASSTDWEVMYVFSPPAKGVWYNVQSPGQFLAQLVSFPLTTVATSAGFLAQSSILFEFEVMFRGIR